jgi:hypothetical protein
MAFDPRSPRLLSDRPTESRRHHVHLGGLDAAGGRFDVLDDGEGALEALEQRTLRAALEHLA